MFKKSLGGRLLLIFANGLYPDQARQNVGPDLDPNSLTLSDSVFLNELFEKKYFLQKMKNYSARKA